MEIITKKMADVCLFEIHGILDTATSGQAEKQIATMLEENYSKMVIDLSQTDYMSSSGLRVLLSTAKKLWAVNGKLKIAGPNKVVKDILDTSGFSVIMEVKDTAQEALKDFDQ